MFLFIRSNQSVTMNKSHCYNDFPTTSYSLMKSLLRTSVKKNTLLIFDMPNNI